MAMNLPGPGKKYIGDDLTHLSQCSDVLKTNKYDLEFLLRYLSGLKVKRTGRRCWEWMRSTTGKGYGAIYFKERKYRTHRIAHELFNGPIPFGKMVCHKCDNPRCCNPDHLYIGDASTNLKDAMKRQGFKNPCQRGIENHRAKLNDDKVLEIRASSDSYSTLARRYGVALSTIYGVKTFKTWRHVLAYGGEEEKDG